MSTLSSDDHLSPHNPLYYAPRRLRERSQRLPSFAETKAPIPKRPTPNSAAFDALLEDAVAQALHRPLEPEIVPEPPELASERDRRNAMLGVAGGAIAAIGVAAAAALFFVIMVPVAPNSAPPDGTASSMSAMFKAAFDAPPESADGAKPAASEFQSILSTSRTEQPVVSHEQSETLLQQFLQWQQKPTPTQTR